MLTPIPTVLDHLAAGRIVLVADDASRENEVDAILAAEFATPRTIGWMVRHTSGLLCAPIPTRHADALRLPPLVAESEDPRGTAYTVTVDARDCESTGISATDRARTVNTLAHPSVRPRDLIRPGHILPLRGHPLGLRGRRGHTEATLELLGLAGLRPAGVLAELVDDGGEMLRLSDVADNERFAGMALTTVAEISRHISDI